MKRKPSPRVLFLTKYGPKAASTRYRYLQYFRFLEAAGIRCSSSPLLDDDYLTRRFATGMVPVMATLRGYGRRLATLLAIARQDALVIQYETLPYLPAWLERLLNWRHVPYVLDLDDAIFHNYDRHRLPLVRRLLGAKISRLAAAAALVTAGNDYLAGFARRYAKRVEILPTVVDSGVYRPAPRAGDRMGPLVVGWIGSPSTAEYLKEIAGALKTLVADSSIRVVLVGSGDVSLPEVGAETRPWVAEREVEEIQNFDVGVMPVPDTPWARGKSGFKLIQYMACGLPIVASPVGANRDIVENGVTGFLADTREEWIAALRRLRDDPGLARRMGQAGRRKFEREYSFQVTAPRLASLLRSVAAPETEKSASERES